MQESLSITPNRLFAVAEAILKAIQSDEGMNACISVWVDEPPQGIHSLSAFTQQECVAAMSLLIRMGYIDPDCRKGSSRARR